MSYQKGIEIISLKPWYPEGIKVNELNLEDYLRSKDAHNVKAISTYLERYDLETYAICNTAKDIMSGNKSKEIITLIAPCPKITLSNIIYNNQVSPEASIPNFDYFRSTRFSIYLVFFEVKRNIHQENNIINLLIKVHSSLLMKNSRCIAIALINSETFDMNKNIGDNSNNYNSKTDNNDDDDANDDDTYIGEWPDGLSLN